MQVLGQVPGRFRAGSGEVPKQVPVMLRGKVGAGSGMFPRFAAVLNLHAVAENPTAHALVYNGPKRIFEAFKSAFHSFLSLANAPPDPSPGLELTSENGYGSSLIKHFYGSSQKELSTLSMARKDLQDVIVVVDSKEDTLESVL